MVWKVPKEFLHQAAPRGMRMTRRGAWLPLDVYKNVRPFIEKLVEDAGRPMSYEELHSKLFDAMGLKRAISHNQIGGHISRSKKLARFRIKYTVYAVSKSAMDKFMAGRVK